MRKIYSIFILTTCIASSPVLAQQTPVDQFLRGISPLNGFFMPPMSPVSSSDYLEAFITEDIDRVRELNNLGANPIDFVRSGKLPHSASVFLVEALFETTALLPQDAGFTHPLMQYLIYRKSVGNPSVVAPVWATLIRKGLTAEDQSYMEFCNYEYCGPLAYAVQNHHEELMMEILVGLKLFARGAYASVAEYTEHAQSDFISMYRRFYIVARWCRPGNLAQIDTQCHDVPRRMLQDRIDRLESNKALPRLTDYRDALFINEPAMVRRLNALGGDPTQAVDDISFQYLLHEALGNSNLDLFKALLEGVAHPLASIELTDFIANNDQIDPLERARIWEDLIRRGLPSDENFYNALCGNDCGPRAFAREHNFGGFLHSLRESTPVNPNQALGDGFNLYERALQLGYLKLAEYLKSLGGSTKRLVLFVATDAGRMGSMYNHALDLMTKKSVLVATLSPPYLETDSLIPLVSLYPGPSIYQIDHPTVNELKAMAKLAVSLSDGIWISGGADVWEKNYNPLSSEETPQDLLRDILEFAILDEQQSHPYKPVMGVCRGMQVINVFHGGSLQNKGQSGVNPIQRTRQSGTLGSAFDNETLIGWSSHHQSVDQLSDKLEVVARTEDGMVKALQWKNKDLPLMGTQFHPEANESTSDLFLRTNEQVIARFLVLIAAAHKKTCFAVESEEGKTSCKKTLPWGNLKTEYGVYGL